MARSSVTGCVDANLVQGYEHFDMATYPFVGDHEKPAMPSDKPGAPISHELATIQAGSLRRGYSLS